VDQTISSSRAYITIRDHGPGVPEEELPKLFMPFYRVDNSRTRLTGGNGLGLAIAARAIALHSGTIRAHNAPDGGMIVEIRIPLQSVRQPVAELVNS
jgi:two-component system, OmpR family, sensor histidine kinase CpxA